MAGIAGDKVDTFRRKVESFSSSYIRDWDDWLATDPSARPAQLGRILRKWQACRPNRMRREEASATHLAPFLDDLLVRGGPHVETLSTFDIAAPDALEPSPHTTALEQLWEVFEQLSYQGRSRQGLAGSVGISKAVMLATNGRVGPAFDSSVSRSLKIGKINNSSQWRRALAIVNADIQEFQRTSGTAFAAAKPSMFAALHNGRVYDMALGPR